MAPPKSVRRLRIERELPRVVAEHWARGQAATWIGLATALGATRENGVAVEQPFRDAVDQLTRAGVITPTMDGHKKHPWIFNWTGQPTDGATLAPAVEAYLTDPAVSTSDKAGLRTALRKVLPEMVRFRLPARAQAVQHDREFVKAAALVPAPRILEVLRRAQAARADGEYARQVRLLLKHAADHHLAVMVLPTPVGDDACDAFRNRVWPLGEAAEAASEVKRGRNAWNVFKDAAKAWVADERIPRESDNEDIPWVKDDRLFERDPSGWSPQVVMQIIQYTRTHLGRLAAPSEIERALLDLRDRPDAPERDRGPFRMLEANPFVRRSTRGRTPALYLTHPGGRTVLDHDWDDLLVAIEAHGLPADEWRAFFAWYVDYCRLDIKAYKARQKVEPGLWPARAAARHLTTQSLRARFFAARLWLGTALYELDLDPTTLTPVALFGRYFEDVMNAAGDWWDKRAHFAETRRRQGLPTEDSISHEDSGGLQNSIVSAGMIALALYDRERMARGAAPVPLKGLEEGEPVDSPDRTRGAGVDTLRALSSADLREGEALLLQAYRACCAESAIMRKARKKSASDMGGMNSRKGLPRIIQQTPASWWLRVYREMRDRAEKLYRGRTALSLAEAVEVSFVFTFGVFLATGARESEVYGAKLRWLNRHTRDFNVPGASRKNQKPLFGRLHPNIVPDWLLDLYLDVARVALVRHPRTDGDSLVLNQEGRRVRGSSQIPFLEAIAQAAVSIGLTIPPTANEFGEHIIRAAMGHAIRQVYGTAAAARFLGDTEATVEKAYSFLDGRNLDLSAVDGLEQLGPIVPTRRATPPLPSLSATALAPVQQGGGVPTAPVQAGYSAELARLVEDRKGGFIDPLEFQEAKLDLRRRYGVGEITAA